MKKYSLLIIGLCHLSCEQTVNKEHNHYDADAKEVQHEIVDTNDLAEKSNKTDNPSRDSINKLLDNPFDLHQFKTIKKMANSGGGGKYEYYFKPDKNGMYYRYFMFPPMRGYIGSNKKRVVHIENGLSITVYKELGQNRYLYNDSTETLIEVKANYNDYDLPELAFVGLDSATIIKRLGASDYTKDNCLIYQHNNKALILKLSNSKVKWLRYVVLRDDYNIETDEVLCVD